MINDFLIPFITILLAELGDKTQLAVFSLSTKTKKYYRLLLGVILAFALADGLAILFGELITRIIPIHYIKLISGLVFIIFGIMTFLDNDGDEEKFKMHNPFITGFTIVFLAELGDKTQIASGLFATQYNPLAVFLAVMLALSILSIIAVFLGEFVAKKVDKRIISKVAATLFILIGLAIIYSAIRLII